MFTLEYLKYWNLDACEINKNLKPPNLIIRCFYEDETTLKDVWYHE